MMIANGTSPYLNTAARAPRALATLTAAPQGSADSVTLSAGSADFGAVGTMTVAGAVPVAGAVANFMAMVGAGLNKKEGLSYMNLAASGGNLIGTGSLVAGLISGNSTATNIGLGLLGASGLAAGVTAYALTKN